MNKNTINTIEIQGQLYDATSGEAVPVNVVKNTQSSARSLNHVESHAPATTPILMRTAVKKPGPSLKRQLKIASSTDSPGAAMTVQSSPYNLGNQRGDRDQRATRIQQSDHINHFVTPQQFQVVQPPPVKAPEPVSVSLPPKTPTDELLERALQRAPIQPPSLPKRSFGWRRFSLISIPIVIALLIIGGGYTKFELQVATARAGFTTSLPAYQPAGYGLRTLSYSSGTFASEFQNKNGSQNYTITQRTTAWNNAALLSHYIEVNTPSYQVVQLGNQTLYLYGDGNITWVAHGIWYQINSAGALSEPQLINLANSL